MKSGLQEKRSSFAKEIRRQIKSDYFREIRKERFGFHDSLSQLPTQSQQIEFQDALINVEKGQRVQQSLNSIATHINSERYKLFCYKTFEKGLHIVLINNLTQKQFIGQSLLILLNILSKDGLQYASSLVNMGLLELLLQILDSLPEYTEKCLNCIGNICVEESSYSEVLLNTNVHLKFIRCFWSLFESQEFEGMGQMEALRTNLWLIRILIDTDSNMQYHRQWEEIMDFYVRVLEKRITTKEVWEGIYFLSSSIESSSRKKLGSVFNQLLQEATEESGYLQSLLIIIRNLSSKPFVDIDLIISLGVTAKGNILKLIIEILSQAITGLESDLRIPEIWWEKALIRIQNQPSECLTMMVVIRRLHVLNPPVWNFIYSCLCQNFQHDLLKETLLVLNLAVKRQPGHRTLDCLQKYEIRPRLEQLMEAEQFVYSDKCLEILQDVDRIRREITESPQSIQFQ